MMWKMNQIGPFIPYDYVNTVALISNFLGMAGTAFLVVPAVRLNKITKNIKRASKLSFDRRSDDFLKEQVKNLVNRLSSEKDSWRWHHQFLLFSGIILLIFSYFINMIDALGLFQ